MRVVQGWKKYRKFFEFPENICKKKEKDNCRNLDKGRNSEDKFCPEPNRKIVTCTVCMTSEMLLEAHLSYYSAIVDKCRDYKMM